MASFQGAVSLLTVLWLPGGPAPPGLFRGLHFCFASLTRFSMAHVAQRFWERAMFPRELFCPHT